MPTADCSDQSVHTCVAFACWFQFEEYETVSITIRGRRVFCRKKNGIKRKQLRIATWPYPDLHCICCI